jgi:acyl-CoA thioesterase-2
MDETALPPQKSPEELAAMLVTLLDVEEIDTDLYRGSRQPGGHGRVFGGQVIAQALQAAQRSVAGKDAHSLHAYFMRPGDEDYPIIFRVIRDFEGRSFATRRVVALQKGQPILNLAASFQLPEDGFHHQNAMPDVPSPEELKSEQELRLAVVDRVPERVRPLFLRRQNAIEMRPLYPRSWFEPVQREPTNAAWFRVAAPIGDDPRLHRAALAYASDMALMATAMMPHGVNWLMPGMQCASLDHALWLHEPFRADEWLLYTTDSPWAGHARGMNRGSIFTRDGRLVASVAQEGLMRRRTRAPN